jgi:hypothetical protein
MDEMELLRIAKKAVQSAHYPNVQGISIGYKYKDGKKTDEKVIQVWVDRKLPRSQLLARDTIPEMLFIRGHGIKTDVIQSKFRSLALVDHGRPVRPGFSCGHPDITAGTLGFFACRRGAHYLITTATGLVSNAHVIADTNEGEIGDPVYYPGPYDGGEAKDTIAHLAVTIPIEMIESTCPISRGFVWLGNFLAKLLGSKDKIPNPVREIFNRVDCAFALLDEGVEIDENIYGIGKPIGIKQAALGMKVQKTGRTSEHTEGEIIGIEAEVQVGYSEGVALFDRQIISDIESAGGDSGSAILTLDNEFTGLLFAGGEGFTIANPIEDVFEALELELPQNE